MGEFSDRVSSPHDKRYRECMAEMSGLPEAEIRWIFTRGKELRAAGLSDEQIKRALRIEARDRFDR